MQQEPYQSGSRSHKRPPPSPPHELLTSLASNDSNSWYYPASFEAKSDEEDVLPPGSTKGNWGRKRIKSTRWVRRGKKSSWGPEKYEWELEERVRKRLKAALPQPPRSPSPPVLPHLRSPSPPLTAPYPQLTFQHSNYSSLIMDPSVQHSFRSQMLGDISRAINNLIEGEAAMKRAVGRLWQAVYAMKAPDAPGPSDPQKKYPSPPANGDVFGGQPFPGQDDMEVVPLMDGMEEAMQVIRAQRDPLQDDDFNSEEVPKLHPLPPFLTPGLMGAINELAGDSAEYVALLGEVREGLGFTLGQRDALWTTLREKALLEMQQQEEEEEE